VNRLFSSLYGRISLVFLVLLVALFAIQFEWSRRSSKRFVHESEQSLNRTLAHDLAVRFEPHLEAGLDREAIEHLIHELMVMNPRVEIYILDDGGNTLAYFHDPSRMKRMQVDLAPIQAYLADPEGARLPIYGDDPRSLDRKKPFSVAPIEIGPDAKPGYVYVILGSELYDSASAMVAHSYTLRTSLIGLGATFVVTALAGLLLFSLVTRRLGVLTRVVQRFHQGNVDLRAPVNSSDEIGQLSLAFNRMADTIVASVSKLRETDRLRRELIANVSHDLRSPLASMQGYLETIIMKEDTLKPDERRRFLTTITGNVQSLSKMVDELFELSKLEAEQTKPDLEYFSMAELAQDIALKFTPQAEQRGIRLATRMDDGLPSVFADIGLVERALSNLIENALRFTPQDGEVTVSLKRSGNGVVVEVSDTGTGIPAADLPHIFERFYRVEKSRSRASGGAGLGLAIANRIVQIHGGRITVESESGAGTTFAFNLATSPIGALAAAV